MAVKGGHIDFMFLGPTYPTAGSATGEGHASLAPNPLDPPLNCYLNVHNVQLKIELANSGINVKYFHFPK